MNKKPRFGIDIKQEDIYPQLQTFLQQQRIMQQRQQQPRQPQQMLQSLPQMQRAHLQQQHLHQQQHLQQHQHLQQQQYLQLRQQVQQGIQPLAGVKRPYESGVCARRLMQYIYHQRHRPPENTIIYWRKIVAEYFAPRATRRWCLSMYDNIGLHGWVFSPRQLWIPLHLSPFVDNKADGYVLENAEKIKHLKVPVNKDVCICQELRFRMWMISKDYWMKEVSVKQ